MDIVSHGLWGGLLFGRAKRRDYLAAFAFGIGPDLFSFGIFTTMTVLGLASGPDWSQGTPSPNAVPMYVHHLYNLTHSLFVFTTVFGLVWALKKRPYWPMLAWPFHILLDIPTHSTNFFPTPFLWPFISYRVNGISWAHPWVFFPNWAALLVGYVVWFWKKSRKKVSKL